MKANIVLIYLPLSFHVRVLQLAVAMVLPGNGNLKDVIELKACDIATAAALVSLSEDLCL